MSRGVHHPLLVPAVSVLGLLVATALVGTPLVLALGTAGSSLLEWTNGARGTVLCATVVLVVGLGVGTFAGAAAALGPPGVDALLSQVMEIAGALPSVVVVVVLRALRPAPDLVAIAAVLALLRGLVTAKVVRADLMRLLSEDFVLAARALGSGRFRLFRRHLLPHVVGPALSGAVFSAAAVVGLDAALSLVGLEGSSSGWGALLARAAETSTPTIAFGPVLGVAAIVLCLHVVADALEDRWSVGRRFV
jgi:peptide/nickel transport system permease protein